MSLRKVSFLFSIGIVCVRNCIFLIATGFAVVSFATFGSLFPAYWYWLSRGFPAGTCDSLGFLLFLFCASSCSGLCTLRGKEERQISMT